MSEETCDNGNQASGLPEINLSRPGDKSDGESSYPVLLGLDGNLKGQRFLIDKKVVTIGRNMSADIVPHDGKCARRHAYVIYSNIDQQSDQPVCRLHDVGIGGGTFVNDERITQEGYILQENDRIRVGQTNLAFLLHEHDGESLEHKIDQLATLDKPTGLLNYHIFQENLLREMARSHRYHRKLSIILMHLDNLVGIREKYGIQCSNRLLNKLGHYIHQFLRANDMPARHSHDELAIVLPETDQHGAESAARRLLESVDKETFSDGEIELKPKFSIGITTWNDKIRTPEELLERAEKALKNAYRQDNDQIGTLQ
ncbi:MAG: diguanylate cyclase domain-containing protein [Candidatus Sumerlaeota bacterium]